MSKPTQKKHRVAAPCVHEILTSTQQHSMQSLMKGCSETQQLQTILDSILPHYFGFIENHSVTVGKVKNGVASLFFNNPSLASQARFILQPIIPTLQRHYGLSNLRSFKIIAQSASTDVKLPKRRYIQRQALSRDACLSLMETAHKESDHMLSDAIARLAYHASYEPNS